MSIVRDAVKIRLYKPGVYYRIYTAEAFNGTASNTKVVCGIFNALAIEPSQSSFTYNGESWFEVGSDSGDNRVRLIESPELIALLSQDGVPINLLVQEGRWAMTRIRLVSNSSVNVGNVVRYRFELMCYKPLDLTSGGGVLVLGTRSFNLEFPIQGVPMQSVTAGGAFATEKFISPFDFYPTVVAGSDSAGLTDKMTNIRSWIWGRDTTFNLGGWTLSATNTNVSPLAVLDSWNRAFRNVSEHVKETSVGIRPLGYATGSGNDFASNATPYFNTGFAASNTQNVTTLLSGMASGGGWKVLDMNFDLVFHAAPSPKDIIGEWNTLIVKTTEKIRREELALKPLLKKQKSATVRQRASLRRSIRKRKANIRNFRNLMTYLIPGRAEAARPFAGRWQWTPSDQIVTVYANGTTSSSYGVRGTWIIEDFYERIFSISWSSGFEDTVIVSLDGKTATQSNQYDPTLHTVLRIP